MSLDKWSGGRLWPPLPTGISVPFSVPLIIGEWIKLKENMDNNFIPFVSDSPPPLDDFTDGDDDFTDFTTASHDFDIGDEYDSFSDQPLPQVDNSSVQSSPVKSHQLPSTTPDANDSEANEFG